MAANQKRARNLTTWIGAADCAARTGLSARALRLYEQQQLIKPIRDANGWRRYSSTDLSRLNTIAVLKILGLSLSQIRTQLSTGSSSLEGVLRIQMEAWKARKATAEEAIALVEGALNQVKLHRQVSIDQMCELVRRLEMNSYVPGFRRLIAENITPDESQSWSTWWAQHPDDLAESGRYFEAQNVLFHELKAAMDAGVDAGSTQAGSLMVRWESLLLTHHVRERAVRQMRWNYDVTLKWYTVGHKNRVAEREFEDGVAASDIYTPEFAAFLDAAYQKSDHGKALNAVHDAVATAMAAGKSPSSAEAQRLAQRFSALCAALSLGDPLIHAQFALFIERVNHGDQERSKSKAWHFLQMALEAHHTSRPALRGKSPQPELRAD